MALPGAVTLPGAATPPATAGGSTVGTGTGTSEGTAATGPAGSSTSTGETTTGTSPTPPPSTTTTPETTAPPPPPPPPPAPVPETLPPADYVLAWSDEFDGTSLDQTKWSFLGDGHSTAGAHDAADPASFSFANGIATDRTFTDSAGVHHVGMLSTEGKYYAQYGYLESRIRFQGAPGTWCGFWIQSPKNGLVLDDTLASGTEIDVVEHRAYDNAMNFIGDSVYVDLNWNGYGSTKKNVGKMATTPTTPLQDEWHTYGVLWTPTKYTWYIDDFPVWETTQALSGQPEFLLLTCQVWDMLWAGPIPAGGYGTKATSTAGMQIDYVRVWQLLPPDPFSAE